MIKNINISGFNVGGKKTFIIADIGSNHMQDLSLAKESIDAAAASGANAVKFQSIQLDKLYLSPDTETINLVKKLEFQEDWHQKLKEYCDIKSVIFFSSPTYLESVDLLEELNVPLYKIASAQIGTFPQIVEKIAKLNKPTIFSTGISTYDDIIKTVSIFNKHKNNNFIILHCNSIYPTPPEKVNLNLIKTYKNMFGNPVGFSDHTNGIHISCAAVTMGANVIEKHFTLSRNLKSPDSNSFASDPLEFRSLVQSIREIELAKNVSHDRMEIQVEEQIFKDSILYRCVANKNMLAGNIIDEKNLDFLRNINGLDARTFFNSPKNYILIKDINKGELITNEVFKYEDK